MARRIVQENARCQQVEPGYLAMDKPMGRLTIPQVIS